MVQLLREISGAGMIMQPSENDFMNPEFRPYLDKYMRGKDVDALSKARLFRLAHDLAISSFGMRQELNTGTAVIRTGTVSTCSAAMIRAI